MSKWYNDCLLFWHPYIQYRKWYIVCLIKRYIYYLLLHIYVLHDLFLFRFLFLPLTTYQPQLIILILLLFFKQAWLWNNCRMWNNYEILQEFLLVFYTLYCKHYEQYTLYSSIFSNDLWLGIFWMHFNCHHQY